MTKVYLVKELETQKIYSSKKKAIKYIVGLIETNQNYSLRTYGRKLNYIIDVSDYLIQYTCEDSDFDFILDIYPLL